MHAALEEPADLPHALAVAGVDALDEPIEVALRAVDPRCELLDGLAARDLALVVAADAVGDDVEAARVVAEERVLVDLTLPADVSARYRYGASKCHPDAS